MTEQEKLCQTRQYLLDLANGLNPFTGESLPTQEIINDVRISRCLFYAAEILNRTQEAEKPTKKRKKPSRPFCLTYAQREKFAFSEAPIALKQIIQKCNDLRPDEDMRKLSQDKLGDWLIEAGVLYNMDTKYGRLKRPTALGEQLGLTVVERHSANGPYRVVLYNRNAQQFIIDNLDSLYAFNTGQWPET